MPRHAGAVLDSSSSTLAGPAAALQLTAAAAPLHFTAAGAALHFTAAAEALHFTAAAAALQSSYTHSQAESDSAAESDIAAESDSAVDMFWCLIWARCYSKGCIKVFLATIASCYEGISDGKSTFVRVVNSRV